MQELVRGFDYVEIIEYFCNAVKGYLPVPYLSNSMNLKRRAT